MVNMGNDGKVSDVIHRVDITQDVQLLLHKKGARPKGAPNSEAAGTCQPEEAIVIGLATTL